MLLILHDEPEGKMINGRLLAMNQDPELRRGAVSFISLLFPPALLRDVHCPSEPNDPATTFLNNLGRPIQKN